MSIPMKKLGTQGLEVAGLGYGAMGLTAFMVNRCLTNMVLQS